MKSLEFSTFQRTESTLENYGTVREQVGQNGKIGLVESNFNNPDKRLVVLLKKETGESVIVACSKRVSDDFRTGKINLTHLTEMNIMVGENGIPFISSQGAPVQEFKIEDIKASKATVKSSFLDENKMKALLEVAI